MITVTGSDKKVPASKPSSTCAPSPSKSIPVPFLRSSGGGVIPQIPPGSGC